ncbi:LAMI_0A05050g1_1 [Lachancea mirantina]|uniref:LAMI_0A05050g1_1 n=1 Tax=Lachancea mirantina TaxID=1230905 RepID=A0A1G4IPC5_9SACH|nr:LAMI_0A05050g1_1 [Lachancea mirantina]
MDSSGYLRSFGWQEGEALKKGGLKRPILVKYKKDRKGLGTAPGHDDSEMWWERLFDGQLKNLEVGTSGSCVTFKQNVNVTASGICKNESPLYRWFVRGEGLRGTIADKETIAASAGATVADGFKQRVELDEKVRRKSKKRSRGDEKHDDKKRRRTHKEKKDKKDKKEERKRHERKDKKHKYEDSKVSTKKHRKSKSPKI